MWPRTYKSYNSQIRNLKGKTQQRWPRGRLMVKLTTGVHTVAYSAFFLEAEDNGLLKSGGRPKQPNALKLTLPAT